MAIHEHVTRFAGFPVKDYRPGQPLKNPARVIYRLSLNYDEGEDGGHLTERVAEFLGQPGVGEAPGLVIGAWEEMYDVNSSGLVEALVAGRGQLASLKALFLGDILGEESEISWINQSDMSPLFEAYPGLEHFRVRGGNGLSLGQLRHERLRSLVIETGGLRAAVVREVAAAELPALEHLELWLGEENYGGDSTVEDLRPILSGRRFPRLRYLGLRDSPRADEIAAAVAGAPVLERVRVLDLSLGNLGDKGAQALLASPAVAALEKLDIHHHYVSKEMVKKLQALGIEVDAGEGQTAYVSEHDGEEYRYIAVSE